MAIFRPALNYDGMETKDVGGLMSVPYGNIGNSFLGYIRESFTGAWQKNVTPESQQNILAFSAVYACVSLIASDIAKLRPMLTEDTGKGYSIEVENNTAHINVLEKPNRYQTRIQFLQEWITRKLMYGNAYILKERDQRNVVSALYVLDPRLVKPMISEDGGVYYQLNRDYLTQTEAITVPASEIIHDRAITLWHPLVGVSPIYACGAAATQGIRIQANSAVFFENMSRPSAMLTYPGKLPTETANSIKDQIEQKYSGSNIGRFLVLGEGPTYKELSIPAEDAQLIQQLGWTIEDVARCFQVPLHKISAVAQRSINYASIGALNQDYYTQTLQIHIEALEILLDEGLGLQPGRHVTLDLSGLLRLDPAARIDTAAKGVSAAIFSPNEARLSENLPPVTGGESPMIQQQNYSLAALAKRDAQPDPFATTPAPTPDPAAPPAASAPASSAAEGEALALTEALIAKFMKAPAYA